MVGDMKISKEPVKIIVEPFPFTKECNDFIDEVQRMASDSMNDGNDGSLSPPSPSLKAS